MPDTTTPRRLFVSTYEAKDGWRWRLKARNGRIVAESGESYYSEHECERAVNRLLGSTIERHPSASALLVARKK